MTTTNIQDVRAALLLSVPPHLRDALDAKFTEIEEATDAVFDQWKKDGRLDALIDTVIAAAEDGTLAAYTERLKTGKLQ